MNLQRWSCSLSEMVSKTLQCTTRHIFKRQTERTLESIAHLENEKHPFLNLFHFLIRFCREILLRNFQQNFYIDKSLLCLFILHYFLLSCQLYNLLLALKSSMLQRSVEKSIRKIHYSSVRKEYYKTCKSTLHKVFCNCGNFGNTCSRVSVHESFTRQSQV